MRELQIIQSIFDQVLRKVQEDGENRVIRLVLGELSELGPASIQTHWNELSKGSLAEHAQLYIRLKPADVQCMACFQKYHPAEKKVLGVHLRELWRQDSDW